MTEPGLPPLGADERFAIVGATIIDGTGAPPIPRGTVLIQHGQIVAAGPADEVPLPAGLATIDASGMTVLPGMMDLHAHLCFAPNLVDPLVAADEDPFAPDGYLALWGARHARILLEHGFTTVRDAFAWSGRRTSLALRDAINDGAVPGPSMVCAGYAGMTGTEVDMRMPPNVPRPYGFVADGPWPLRQRVRECVREGYEWIKTFTSGGRVVGGQEEDTWFVSHTLAEMAAIVDEAHRFGIGVMAHASTRDAVRLAVDAGVDTVEHGWPLDDELIAAMLAKGIALVPTISTYSARGFLRDGVHAPLRIRAERQYLSRAQSFRRAYEAGVIIGHGTDAYPPTPSMGAAETAFELAMCVAHGMRPMDAIVSATGGAARILGIAARVGTLQPGKAADVVAVAGDPLTDPSALETEVMIVVKGGEVAFDRRPSIQFRTPAMMLGEN